MTGLQQVSEWMMWCLTTLQPWELWRSSVCNNENLLKISIYLPKPFISNEYWNWTKLQDWTLDSLSLLSSLNPDIRTHPYERLSHNAGTTVLSITFENIDTKFHNNLKKTLEICTFISGGTYFYWTVVCNNCVLHLFHH